MGKLVDFLSDIERESNSTVLTPEAVAQAARDAGLAPDDVAAVASGDPLNVSRAIGVDDPTVVRSVFIHIEAPDEEEEEEEEDDEK